LGEGNGDWGWLVSDQVLQVTSGDIGVHKLEETVSIRFSLIELHESLGNWCIGVLDQVNESGLGHVLSIKLTNLELTGVVLLRPVGGLIINRIISVIVWETLVEDLLEGLASSEYIIGVGGGGLWDSLDHDGKGDVVVVGDVLLLISGSVQDGVEGVVSNDLSEGLEGHGLNHIVRVGWVDLQGDGLHLIDWHVGGLTESIEWIGGNLGELGLCWLSWLGGGLFGLHVLAIVVVLVMVLVLKFGLNLSGSLRLDGSNLRG
jgi:hypothetical protein